RGFAYPLKRNALDVALDSAGVTRISHVHYSFHRSCDELLRADFSGEASAFSGQPQRFLDEHGSSSITIYGVPSQERAAVATTLLADGLPALCRWLSAAERAGNVWRAAGHHLVLRYAG